MNSFVLYIGRCAFEHDPTVTRSRPDPSPALDAPITLPLSFPNLIYSPFAKRVFGINKQLSLRLFTARAARAASARGAARRAWPARTFYVLMHVWAVYVRSMKHYMARISRSGGIDPLIRNSISPSAEMTARGRNAAHPPCARAQPAASSQRSRA
ncbi:hypothetical protein EVAR_39492_1 [Eumeta japonica]|uniref:Uncharacterized protein n=1 Tax=Eumeta variegata TaxID=151549 RepID=A0A4C1W094_EUMVA|nr:hypothetical protein EVAR_39492_1 [Eumeta japonica]